MINIRGRKYNFSEPIFFNLPYLHTESITLVKVLLFRNLKVWNIIYLQFIISYFLPFVTVVCMSITKTNMSINFETMTLFKILIAIKGITYLPRNKAPTCLCPPTSASWRMGYWTCVLICERQLANQGLIHTPLVSPYLLLWQDNEGTLVQLQTQTTLLWNYWEKKNSK